MMRLWFILMVMKILGSLCVIPNPTGNNFTICNWDTIIYDPKRPEHRIPLKTHYPCETENGPFPIMVFGHASQSQNTWYDYIWTTIVPQGYIITLPGSYEYLNDSHKLFAADMAYTLEYFYDECNVTDISCPLYNNIMNKSIVSGHSLGGAASLLVAASTYVNSININNETFKYKFTSMMTLSGCGVDSIKTNYTYAAKNIKYIPSLLITGSSDCMCNPPYNVSIVGYYYDIPVVINNTCKYLAIITNGTHCHFQQDTNREDESCELAERHDCNKKSDYIHIDKEIQWNIVNQYFALFMYQTLYKNDNNDSITAVENQLIKDQNDGIMTRTEIYCDL